MKPRLSTCLATYRLLLRRWSNFLMPYTNRMHLDPLHIETVESILNTNVPAGVDVYAFGSRATGTRLKPFSDLDLCLKGAVAMDDDVVAGIAAAFRDSNLPIKVDVVDWSRMSDDFRAAIAPDLKRVWPKV